MKTIPLDEYKKKRDFEVTPEPRPLVKQSAHNPIFVVQEHHASRLHYDFRLEADGVLKSWAVPKEPSIDPSTRRLAVQVEDHPLAYAKFSGVIPKGEYGAGVVKIWDKGTYENLLAKKTEPRTLSEAISDGHVEIRLHGKRLNGNFALIRMKMRRKKSDWLLVKMKDDAAKSSRRAKGTGRPRRRTNEDRVNQTKKRVLDQKPGSFEFTNLDKVLFPQLKITKGDVLRFYQRISDRLLPHIKDRPMTLERLPEGIKKDSPHFWQKNTPSYYPEWIPRIEIESEDGEAVEYALVNNVETLLYLVNQGTLTFHPWFSRVETLDQPDFVLFDLDPGKATFSDVVSVARTLNRELERESVRSFIKTSGKSGLHVLVPWLNGDYEEAREWARRIAERIVNDLPDSTTLERSKSKRGGKVYLDVMQNVRGHHAVPPYVLRAVPQATVSTPLRWSEVTDRLNPLKFNLKSVFQRLARQKEDPFYPLVSSYVHARS